jgi:Ca2+-binding EF-hand superfamily protein
MENTALRARFDGYDQDGDGALELSELSTLLDALGAGYDLAQVRAAFEDIDVDADGRIGFDEFAAWWVGR